MPKKARFVAPVIFYYQGHTFIESYASYEYTYFFRRLPCYFTPLSGFVINLLQMYRSCRANGIRDGILQHNQKLFFFVLNYIVTMSISKCFSNESCK
jgi:hypothetical protein